MKRLLLPLLAAIALPTAVNAGYESDIDLMTDKREILVWVLAENLVENVIGTKRPVGLVIQCGSEDTFAYLQTENVVSGKNTNIRIRWDGAEPITENWKVSTNGKQIATKNSKEFIRKLENSSNIIFGWVPYMDSKKAAKFNLNSQNFKEDLIKARKNGCDI